LEARTFLNKNEKLLGQKAFVIWLTGLSGSGKSTIGCIINQKLYNLGYISYVLDGDKLRNSICKDLGFSQKDRETNLERAAQVAKILTEAGIIVIATFITPFRSSRDYIKNLLGKDKYIEVFVKCTIEECIRRDPKCLYKKALNSEINDFTGISSPYEEPISPDITIDTNIVKPYDSAGLVIEYLANNNLINLAGKNG